MRLDELELLEAALSLGAKGPAGRNPSTAPLLIVASGICANKMSEALGPGQPSGSARTLFASNFYHGWACPFADLGPSLALFSPDSISVLAPSYAQPHDKPNSGVLRVMEAG